MANQKINYINTKVEVLDKEKCNGCEYFEMTGKDIQVIYGFNSVIWPSKKRVYQCQHLKMCQYLQKLFASETPSKVEESESDP